MTHLCSFLLSVCVNELITGIAEGTAAGRAVLGERWGRGYMHTRTQYIKPWVPTLNCPIKLLNFAKLQQ